jgi:molybdopterin/thiamine biosynthesis adenylyltransferase/rhodanese-related sulfurtransferase
VNSWQLSPFSLMDFSIILHIQMDNFFSQSELERYSRHLVLPEIGLEGQRKLKNARVLIIGMGGLGSPLGLYLSAIGVGKLGLLDYDIVSISNLHRQVIFNTGDMGKPKALVAEQKLKSLNPDIEIESYNEQLTTENAFEIFDDYDIVADGSDNFQTRYLVNDTCVRLGKPNVYGSILRFEGQVSVFIPELGPCYRCLYPEPPSPGSVPSCEEGGVIGVLPGIIGSIQANEVIKLIIGKGELLTGRLIIVDALNMKFKELTFEQNPDCPVCGDNPTIKQLLDYETFCRDGSVPRFQPITEIKMQENNHEITAEQLKQKLDLKEKFILLDVREPFEKQIADIGGVLIPMNSLPSHLGELNKEDEIIVYCHLGGRSQYASEWLRSQGYNAKNLTGGINAWSIEIDHSVAKY